MYGLMRVAHRLFFERGGRSASFFAGLAAQVERSRTATAIATKGEHIAKSLLLSCEMCGDCAIQHVGFLCPESQCPKHLRNGPCGGSQNRHCEVHPDKQCVWVRAYERMTPAGQTLDIVKTCVPPRMQSLTDTSSWLNFHRRRDHQGALCDLSQVCTHLGCPGRRARQFSARKLFGDEAQGLLPRRKSPSPPGDGDGTI